MPGLGPNRRAPPPPNVTVGQCGNANLIMSNQQWMVNNSHSRWSAAPASQSVRAQGFDVIARRRNPHWGVGTSVNCAVATSPAPVGQVNNSPLTPTPTPSPAVILNAKVQLPPSPISPAYPNRPISVKKKYPPPLPPDPSLSADDKPATCLIRFEWPLSLLIRPRNVVFLGTRIQLVCVK